MKPFPFDEMKTVSWWFDWTDLQYPAPRVIDRWRKRAEAFKRIGVDTVVTFGFHFRWDWLNYWTRYHAILKEVTDLCHSFGIRVIDHHSNQLTHHIRTEADRMHIVTCQDHHLPLYPDSWENQRINGKKMKDWRMISAQTGDAVYLNGYQAEAFCPANPDYMAEYALYLKKLVAETGIDGVMSDDTAFHGDMYSCGCPYCRERFRQRTGGELPLPADVNFWNNFESPLFQEWIAMRYDMIDTFYLNVRRALPEGMPMWGCSCSDSHPYKVRQGCSMESWAAVMDVVFVEMYHALDFEQDSAAIRTELAVASSLADYHNRKALVLCYSDDCAVLQKWADLCAEYGCLTWFCRQVRQTPVVYEDEILKNGYPVSRKAERPYGCGIVYSRRLKNRIGDRNSRYYELFRSAVARAENTGLRPQIIFDTAKPADMPYELIYAPGCNRLDREFRQWLAESGRKIISEDIE